MENTRLVKLLKTFSKTEMRELSEYVRSPFFNKNENVINLFKQVSLYYPDFNSKSFTEEKLFAKMFKQEPYDYFKLKNIISDLYRLAMDYFRYKNRGDTYENKITFLMELRGRNLLSHYESEYKKVIKNLDDTAVKDDNYLYNRYQMSAEKSYYNFLLKPNTGFNFAQEQLDTFLQFSVIRLLKLYTLMLYEMKQNNVNYDLKFIEEIKSYLLSNENLQNPTFLLYKNILLLELNRDRENYFNIKELQDKYKHQLTQKDMYMSFIHRGGFCAYIYNIKGEKTFLPEMLDVHKGMLREGFYDSYKLPYPDFVNFVKIGTLNGEYKYTDDFITKYKDGLLEEEKENCINFSEAYISFHKGELQKSLELFSRINFGNFILKIQVKLLQIQIYAELGLYEQLLSAIDTCRHYLRSEPYITEIYKKTVSEFLIAVKDVAAFKAEGKPGDGFRKKEIRDKIEKLHSNIFGVKLWLKDFYSKAT